MELLAHFYFALGNDSFGNQGMGAFLASKRHTVQFLPFVCVNLQVRSRYIFLEMFDPDILLSFNVHSTLIRRSR